MTPELLLAHLRAARVRAQLAICEIDTIGVTLKAGAIGVDDGLDRLNDVAALRYLLDPNETEAEVQP